MTNREHKFKKNSTTDFPNTGKMLVTFFAQRRIRKSALARLLGRKFSTLKAYEKRTSIQVAILWELSHALKHNFFMDIAAMLPSTYTTQAPPSNLLQEKIAELEHQLELATTERDILLKAMQ